MSKETARGRTLAIRLTPKFNEALQRKALEESNAPSSVARRLISAGLERELRHGRRDDESDQ